MRSGRSLWIPVGFTVAYFVVAYLVGPSFDHGGFITLGRFIALLFAGVSTIVLWPVSLLVYLFSRGRAAPTVANALIMTGIVCPAAVAMFFYAWGDLNRQREIQPAHKAAHSQTSDVRDELLLSAKGNPIGVRIHFAIRYDGAPDDQRYPPAASLGLSGLWSKNSCGEPEADHLHKKQAYECTVDFVPDYAPREIFTPGGNLAGSLEGSCFFWNPPPPHDSRQATLQGAPQHYPIHIEAEPGSSYNGETTNLYSHRAFYDGLVKEGAKECQ